MAAKEKKKGKKSENSKRLYENYRKKKEEMERKKEIEEKQKKQDAYSQKIAQIRKERRTSIIKLAGVKSTFQLDDYTLLVTSFGRGNDAILDHRIEGDGEKDEICKLAHESGIQIYPAEQRRFPARGREIDGVYPTGYIQDFRKTTTDSDRSYTMLQKDIKKEWLERHFFGEVFSDNIHVQLAYCILDIKKALALHINHIVYTLNNLDRNGGNERDDLVGKMPYRATYEEFSTDGRSAQTLTHLRNFADNPRIGYFGDIFTFSKNASDEERDKYTYEVLASISLVRNFCAHHYEEGCASLYNLTTEGNAEARNDFLNTLYKDKIDSLHKDFAENSFVNITLLKELKAFKNIGWDKLAGAYYQYSIQKKHKNLGFSIKKLREKLVAENAEWREQKFDSVRGKFYQLMDYLLYFHYAPMGEYTAACEEIVAGLRRCLTDQDKDALYERAAQQVWEQQKESLEQLPDKMTGEYIRKVKMECTNAEDPLWTTRREEMRAGIEKEQIRADFCVPDDQNADLFCKAIYLLTHFLDGKEINDLLTTLIHQFENISSFIKVLHEVKIPCRLNDEYKMFESSQKIADGLRIINNFARMSKENAQAKMYMYVEASQILGMQDSEQELQAIWENIFREGKEQRSNRRQHPNGFRNFIANNVVDSSRFRYLIRYTDPSKVSKLAKNQAVVEYVLSSIPDTQIERYYRSCHWDEFDSIERKRKKLAERIQEFSYDEMKRTVEDENFSKDGKKKQELVTLTSLYLTVLYLTSKNLVLVNSRYFLGFYLLELDQAIYHEWVAEKHTQGNTKFVLGKDADIKKDRRVLTDVWVAEGIYHETTRFDRRFNTEENKPRYSDNIKHYERLRVFGYLHENLVESKRLSSGVIKTFRNQVDHLNFVRGAYEALEERGSSKPRSYFQLYHYIVQRKLYQGLKHEEIKGKLCRHLESGDYSKDFLKWICIPFGYNLPRYKNLTIEGLFDKNHPIGEDEKKRTAGHKGAEKKD